MRRLAVIGPALAALLAAGQAAPAGLPAFPQSAPQRLALFQTCAGRLSAEIEHRWLVEPGSADAIAALRDDFDAVIVATLPDAEGVPAAMPMHWRVSAKAAQARLLSVGRFGTDPGRARQARDMAARLMAECRALLIG